MSRLDVIAIPGINPEPWKVGPASAVRRGRHLGAFVAPDQALVDYQETIRDELRNLKVPLLEPNYQLRVWWWRERVQYQGPKRLVTKNSVDQTNLQKAFEDALQPVKRESSTRLPFDGVIANDRDCVYSGGCIVAQAVDVIPLIVAEIYSGLDDTLREPLFGRDMTDLAVETMSEAVMTSLSQHSAQEVPW